MYYTFRNANGKLRCDNLSMNLFFDDIMDDCNNIEEVKFVARNILNDLDTALHDVMENDDINPSGDELTVDDIMMELRGYF